MSVCRDPDTYITPVTVKHILSFWPINSELNTIFLPIEIVMFWCLLFIVNHQGHTLSPPSKMIHWKLQKKADQKFDTRTDGTQRTAHQIIMMMFIVCINVGKSSRLWNVGPWSILPNLWGKTVYLPTNMLCITLKVAEFEWSENSKEPRKLKRREMSRMQ